MFMKLLMLGDISLSARGEQTARKVTTEMFLSSFLRLSLCILSWIWVVLSSNSSDQAVKDFFENNGGSTHTNNWAVLVCSSRYWFNYRVCSAVPMTARLCLIYIGISTWRTPWACTAPLNG